MPTDWKRSLFNQTRSSTNRPITNKSMALTISSFDGALADDADDVNAFTKILPDDLDALPDGILRHCIEEKAPRCVSALLQKYPQYPVNKVTIKKTKATPLHLAAAHCPQETPRYIITCGGSDTDGCEPFTGFMAGKMIDSLLEAGADGTLRDKDGSTPYDLFRKMRNLSSNWENMLMTGSTFMGILPNTYQDKHTRIKEDMKRVQKVLMEAAKANKKSKKKVTKVKRKSSADSTSKKKPKV